MRRIIATFLILLFSVSAAWADLKSAVDALGAAKLGDMETAIKAVAAEPGPQPAAILEALAEGDLYVRKSDKKVFIAKEAGGAFELVDAVTGEAAGQAAKSDLTKIRINNSLRRVIRAAAGGSALSSPDPAKRLEAAAAVIKTRDTAALPARQAYSHSASLGRRNTP